MFFNKLKVIPVTLACFILISCGRTVEQESEVSEILTLKQNKTCADSSENFNQLLEKDISADINCLQETITNLYQSVETSEKKIISKDELIKFITRFSGAPKNENGINLLFTFNKLIRGEANNKINQENFHSILELLKVFNKEAIKFYPYLTEIEPKKRAYKLRFEPKEPTIKLTMESHSMRREEVLEAGKRIQENLRMHLKMNRTSVDTIDLNQLLDFITRKDSLISKLYELTHFSETTIRNLIQDVLDEKIEDKALLKIGSKYGLKRIIAERVNFAINEHTIDGNEELISKIRSLLFIKKLLIGGEKDSLTYLEMQKMVDIFPTILRLTFDIVNFEHIQFSSLKEKFSLLGDNITVLKNLILYDKNESKAILSIDEIVEVGKSMAMKVGDVPLSKLKKSMNSIKKIFAGGSDDYITSKELKTIFEKVETGVKLANFSFEMYDHYKNNLFSHDGPMSENDLFELMQYPASLNELEYKNKFIRAVKTYRFFMGREDLPFYGNLYVRNDEAIVEKVIIEYALGHVMRFLKNSNESESRFHELKLGKDETLKILDIFSDFLSENNLISKHPERTADNARLVTDLFQTQSNGNSLIDISEGVEFIDMLRAATFIGDKLIVSIAKDKNYREDSFDYCRKTDDGIIDLQCFRFNFFKQLRSYKKNFSRLIENVEKIEKEDLESGNTVALKFDNTRPPKKPEDIFPQKMSKRLFELLTKTETFSRECALETRPISKKDITLIMGGLINIESTMIHFDHDQNNELSTEELNDAFPVYKNAIISAAELSKSQEFLSHSIFFYLVKYQKLPSKPELLKFHFFGSKKAIGDRVTIATLLKYINQLSAVEDPDCI